MPSEIRIAPSVGAWTRSGTTISPATAGDDLALGAELFSTRTGANSIGQNIWIGSGGQSALGAVGETYKGSYNTALGHDALLAVTTGFRLTAIGRRALYSSLDAYDVVALGYGAGHDNTSGYSNVFVGNYSAQANTTGRSNVVVGDNAALNNAAGYANTVVGATALYALNHATDNYGNTALGYQALIHMTSGHENTAVGSQALVANVSGIHCTACGEKALDGNLDGNDNTGLGHRTGYLCQHGNGNTYVGAFCADGNAGLFTASENTLVGSYAFFNTAAGTNTALGFKAGYTEDTGTGCVFLGYKAGYYETGSNKLFIDNAPRASEADARTKALIYGVFAPAVNDQCLYVNGNMQLQDDTKIGFGNDKNNYYIGGVVSDVTGVKQHSYYGWTIEGRSGAGLNVLGTGQVGIGKAATTTSLLALAGLPTSAAGLASGDVWLNSNVLTIVP